jgi:hypothetical protein
MEEKKPVLNYRGSAPLKTISINQHIKNKPMNNDNRVMARGLSPKYKFTSHNHFEIIDILDKHRLHHKLDKTEFSKLAGLSGDHFSSVSTYTARFSVRSYAKYRNAINKLSNNDQPKPVYEVKQAIPVYKPTPTNNNSVVSQDMFELNEENCIRFLKATGLYKISKSEVTTNWVEL